MDGTDNRNISIKDLIEFGKNVCVGKVICPKCKKNKLKIDDFYNHEANFDISSPTYFEGAEEDYFAFHVKCDCGFEKMFNSLWCRKGYEGIDIFSTYRVGLAVGGVMEKPEFTYENVEEIKACSEQHAICKYEEKHGRSYWSTVIVR